MASTQSLPDAIREKTPDLQAGGGRNRFSDLFPERRPRYAASLARLITDRFAR